MFLPRVFVPVLCLALVSVAGAAGPSSSNGPRASSTLIVDNTTYIRSGELLMFVGNNGSFAYDRTGFFGKADGLHYPGDCPQSVVFAAGLWIGAKVAGAPRISVAEYGNDFAPGALGGPYPPEDAHNRVYLISRGDDRSSNPDYAEWPFDEGAPSVKDYSGNDSLDGDGYRIPLLKGDQAAWAVFNDADPAYRYASGPGGDSPGPLGVEVQIYTYAFDSTGPLGRTVFMEYTLINKGGNQLDSTFISFWADPDIGDAGDDFVGCDPQLSLGYCYNATNDDQFYGANPPSVGFGLLSGPAVQVQGSVGLVPRLGGWVRGFLNLPMTSFNKYINGTDPGNCFETFNYMNGRYPDGSIVIDPSTNQPTKFMVSGDPVSGTGWLDNYAADRRHMVNSGPFTMLPGDTQEVAVAVMVGSDYTHDCLISLFVDTVYATHVAGDWSGQAIALIVLPDSTTGHDYRITCAGTPGAINWTLHDVTMGTTPPTDDRGVVDGMVIELNGPAGGVSGWEIPSGVRRFTWTNANGFGFEGFNGAIGWASPCYFFGNCGQQGVPGDLVHNVELRLATTDADGNFNPADPNVSYAYRYVRMAQAPPARPEFAPFITNPTNYGFQSFEKSVPMSAWDMDADPPRRLVIGHLENNVDAGLVDGKYWPPWSESEDNTAGSGPREWLWIFNETYSQVANPLFEGSALTDPLPIMYFLTVARNEEVGWQTGDEFLIIPSDDYLTDADVFEFTAPTPTLPPGLTRIAGPFDRLSALTDLRRVDSLALLTFREGFGCSCPCYSDPACLDLAVNVLDVVGFIDVAFRGVKVVHDTPCPWERTDVDCSGATDIRDVICVIDVAFRDIAPALRFCDPCQ